MSPEVYINSKLPGKLCGAIFIDQEFEQVIKLRMGKKWEKLSRGNIKRMMNNEWEHGIKRNYDDDVDKPYTVELPAETLSRSLFRNPTVKDSTKHGVAIKDNKIVLKRYADLCSLWFCHS